MSAGVAMVVASVCVSSGAWAQRAPSTAGSAYPAKPVRIIVGVAPGGATDAQARMFSQRLSESLGHQFVVDNRLGAGGLLGFTTVASATPDGYTLLATSPSLTTVQAFQAKPAYDPVKGFAPISLVTRAPYLVVAHPLFAAKSMSELIAYARSRPDTVNFGLSGLGSIYHLGAAWISSTANIKMAMIPYKGVGPALTDLLTGQIHVTFANPTNVVGHVKSGRLRALAVTSAARSRVFPELQTVAESGVPGFNVTSWQGWLAPKATPAAIIHRLSTELARFVQSHEIAERLAADGGEPVGSTPEQFLQLIVSESARWRQLVKETGMKADE